MSGQQGDMIAERFSVVRKLGSGGMSTVMLANDTMLSRPVAVKLLAEHLASDKDFVTRFRNEALAVARLQHPNIVQIFDSGLDAASGRHYIVMEYVDGTPLSELVSAGQKLNPDQAVAIATDACAALECAHAAQIVHRDVKPANLLIARDGVAKLTDFGIAKASEHTRVTQVGSVLGTVAYLSPEQATGGETGPRSDIYSLAVCVFQMLAGRLPFEYKSVTELALKQRDSRPPAITAFNPLVPRELDRAVRVALSHEPADRYASAAEFGQALRDGLERREGQFVTAAMAHPTAMTNVMKPAKAPRPPKAPQQRKATPPRTPLPPRDLEPTPQPAHEPAPSSGGGKNGKRFAVVALVIAAIAAAGIGGFALGTSPAKPVVEDTVQQQIDGLRGFIQDHSQ